MAASVTLRPLYYPKAIQEQQTQGQTSTGGEGMQVFYGGVLFGARGRGGTWGVVRAAPPAAESVDLGGKPSLPWTDETRAAHCRRYAALRSRAPRLRRRGKEVRAGARSGAGFWATERERKAGCRGTYAPADIESAAAALRLALATRAVWEGLPDPESPGEIRVGRAELQSGAPGSRTQGF